MKKLFNKKTQTVTLSSVTPIHTTDLEPTPSLLSLHKDKLIMAGLGLAVLTLFSTLIFRSSALTNQFIPLSLTGSTETTGSVQSVTDANAAGGSYLKFVSSGGGGSGTRYEAEDAVRLQVDKGCMHIEFVNNYTLTEPVSSIASGGRYCGGFGATNGVEPDRLRFDVTAPSAGTYTMRVAYRNDYTEWEGERAATRWYYVNSESQYTATQWEITGSDNGRNQNAPFATKDYTITLNAGSNYIIWSAGEPFYTNFSDIDYIEIIPAGGTSPNPPTNPNPPNPPDPPTNPNPPVGNPGGKKCRLDLHGKGGGGSGTYQSGDVTVISPNGNAAGWGGRQWLYFPESNYQAIMSDLSSQVSGQNCGQLVVYGFSNGAAMAAKIYCRGETFGGTTVGVMVDDPVPDHGVDNCSPAGGVQLKVYHSQQVADIVNAWGGACNDDWTCEGGTYSTSQYASQIGQTGQIEMPTHTPAGSGPGIISGWWR